MISVLDDPHRNVRLFVCLLVHSLGWGGFGRDVSIPDVGGNMCL